jgi:hypothetical protein
MAIDHKDFMHGAALVAIADSARFTALNKASVKYGHYVVNHDRNIFIKYSDGKGPGEYPFTFTASDKDRIRKALQQGKCFAVMVCGNEVITGVTTEELSQLIDLQAASAEGIRVVAPQGRQLRIKSSHGELPAIPRSSFPERILA